jgi:hypothetical protein
MNECRRITSAALRKRTHLVEQCHHPLYFRRCTILPATSASNICLASIVCQHLPVTSAQASNICQQHLPTSAAHCTQSQ